MAKAINLDLVFIVVGFLVDLPRFAGKLFARQWFDRLGVGPRINGLLVIGLLALLLDCCCIGRGAAQTGTFIDRHLATDLRVVSFNIYLNTIFPEVDPIQAEKFGRVVNALDADILNLQEIKSSAEDVAALLNNIAPLAEGTWYAHLGGRETVIASKYPLSMLGTSIDPESTRPPALALVDLPDAHFERDFYIINHHYVPGSTSLLREQRERNSDATISWLRDARSPGGAVDLPPGTPIAVFGDLNNSPPTVTNTLSTLITGDVTNEGTYGPDSPPDWDGSSFTEAIPLINGLGPENYTLRNTNGQVRIDHIIYSDSALDEANKFVLNSVDMSPTELAATGLQTFDVTIDSIGEVFDHLPLVTDFRLYDFADSDFNFDRVVDHADIALWESDFGLGNEADADGDDDTDGADFLAWQRQVTHSGAALTAAATSIPEPNTLTLLLLLLLTSEGWKSRFSSPAVVQRGM